MEQIPGATTLGFGFDVYGQYGDRAKQRQLFNMVYDGKQTFGDYLVPLNVDVEEIRRTRAESTYVDTRRKIEEYFSSQGKVSAKYGFFSGQFEASYSMTNKSDVSYQFGIYQTYNELYALNLKDRSENALADWVKNDPVYKDVPDQFKDNNRQLFFRFFDKYGMYYMPRVIVGSRLYYSSMINKQYKYSATDAEAKLKLEYQAVFSAAAEAQATWKKVGESWASQREVKIETVGGSNEILNVLIPDYGANNEMAYKSWLKSSEQKPAVVNFDLKPISEVFPVQKAAAVQEAMDAYVLHKLFLESKTGSCLIAFNGEPLLPAPGDANALGYQLAAISRSDLKPAFRQSYSTMDYWVYENLYDRMLADINPYNTPEFIIAFTAFTNFAQNAPTKRFVEFLESCGAGENLALWLATKLSNQHLDSLRCVRCHVNYVFVGIPGSGKGTWQMHEKFTRAGSCDTGGRPWEIRDGWLDKPAPMASLIVDLYQVKKPSDTEFVLEIGKARH